MSLEAVRPYFRARCEAVGMSEHENSFDIDNVPDTIIDDTFFIQFNSFNGIKANQNDQEISIPVGIIFFKTGYRYSSDGIDNALLKVEALIKEVQKPTNRLGTVIKNVTTGSCLIEPISQSNDSTIRVNLVFNLIMTLQLDN